MIEKQYLSVMARYNKWQNESLYRAGDGLGDIDRRKERGAFFGSIHNTLSHLLWGDMLWTSRFAHMEPPHVSSIPESGVMMASWEEMSETRANLDEAIIAWADQVDDDLLTGNLKWYSGAVKREVERPMGEILVHFFNHQTHHRGQVHAMITAAGGKPDDTDLVFMSKD